VGKNKKKTKNRGHSRSKFFGRLRIRLVTMAKQEQLSTQATFAGIGLAASLAVIAVGAVISATH